MSMVFWRSMNGYVYPSNVSPATAGGGGVGTMGTSLGTTLGGSLGAGSLGAGSLGGSLGMGGSLGGTLGGSLGGSALGSLGGSLGGAGYYPYVSAAPHHPGAAQQAPHGGACQALAPFSGAGTTIPSALALAAAAAAGSPATQSPAHKWMMPSYLSSQQMYMFLPKMNKPKTERINKAVKCDICNLTLNSELQAQQHYNGKNHLKKMKQLGMPLPGEDEGKKVIQQYTSEANSEGNEDSSQGEAPEGQGSQSGDTEGSIEDNNSESPSGVSPTNQSAASPSEQPTQQQQPQQQDDDQQTQQQKQEEQQHDQQQHTCQHQLPQQQQQSQQTEQQQQEKLDPVSQAVYDNILGKLPRKRKMEIPCTVCDMIFNSEAQASQHFRGVKHAKRLKMSEDFKPSKSGSDGEASPDVSTAEGGKSCSFYCHYCGVGLNSTQQLEEHREGQLHKKMVERKGPGQGRRGSDEVAGCQPGMMHCKVCDISAPSPTKMQQHMSSLEHQERAAGIPLVDDAPDSPASSSSQHHC